MDQNTPTSFPPSPPQPPAQSVNGIAAPSPQLPQSPATSFPAPSLAPSQKPKTKRVLIVVAAVVLIGVIVAAVALFMHSRNASSHDTNSNVNVATPQPQQSDESSTGSVTYALTSQVKLSAPPTIVRDNVGKDWKTNTASPGAPGIVHEASGCKMYFTEATDRSKSATSSDKTDTDAVLQSAVDDLRKDGSVIDEKKGSVTLKVADSADTIEFEQAALIYKMNVVQFKVITTARSIDGYIVAMRFYCPIQSFSPTLNQQALDTMTIKLPKEVS